MSRRTLLYPLWSLVLCTLSFLIVQAQAPIELRQRTQEVTASVSGEQVRFATLPHVYQIRLEVFAPDGALLFDSDFRAGNMFDWGLHDQQGQRLGDGAYQCVLTVRYFSGRVSQQLGKVALQSGAVSLQPTDKSELLSRRFDAQSADGHVESLAVLSDSAGLATTLLAHDGKGGRLVSGSGGLSFRVGDFFAGKDVEQMRLTAEGNLGLGVTNPQTKLDVAGMIRTSEGILFPDGSIQTTAAAQRSDKAGALTEDGKVAVLSAPTATVNSLAKFVTVGGAVNDSNVFEVGGNVGIGTLSPQGNLHIFGGATSDLFAGMGPNISTGPGFNYGYAGASFGRGAGFFNVRPDGSATPPNPSLRFATQNAQRMIITNNGLVGINNPDPGNILTVDDNFPGVAAILGANANAGNDTHGVGGFVSGAGRVFGVQGQAGVGTALGSAGVRGIDRSGVLGNLSSLAATSAGVWGAAAGSGIGVIGTGNFEAIRGINLNGAGGQTSLGSLGWDDTTGVFAQGNYGGTGAKYFMEPHPTEPGKVIRYVALEGPEAGTYFRGRGKFENGVATIEVPETFRMVSEEEGLSIQVTPIGDFANVAIVKLGLNEIIVKATTDVEFFYTVNGVRRGYKDHPIIVEQRAFTPESPDAQMPTVFTEAQRQTLIKSGVYHEDGTVNLETAKRMGWDKVWEARKKPSDIKAAVPARRQP